MTFSGQNWVDVGVLAPTRAVYYARYIDWVITTPLLLLELLLSTGLPLTELFVRFCASRPVPC